MWSDMVCFGCCLLRPGFGDAVFFVEAQHLESDGLQAKMSLDSENTNLLRQKTNDAYM